MREPAAWGVDPGPRLDPDRVAAALRAARRGPADDTWMPPEWLLPHQRDAARRLAGALRVFGVALLADAVGLGKTWVALALATRYRAVAIVVPAALRTQWLTAARQTGLAVSAVSHEALSRGASVPGAKLIVVDEAHRFRNPATRRYDRLALGIRDADVLFLSATPVVNGARDLADLLRLALPDHALAAFGVPSLGDQERIPIDDLMHAILPLTVARTARVAQLRGRLPVPSDGVVHRLPTVAPKLLPRVLGSLERLRFPPLGDEHRALLHHHLLLRLASSADALAASLRRHRRYLDRAICAAARGERLSRGTAAGLLRDEGADQLELALAAWDAVPVSAAMLRAERRRVDRALARLGIRAPDPKRDAFVAALRGGQPRKAIVFTTARVTAVGIAAALGWRRVAIASGSGARIASGAVSLDEALARFAPHAQQGGPVPPALQVDVLVATDLASEGLNLQDADLVVHYDLPWNPLRLAQRVGRTIRLGGMHETVDVWWFAPPEPIDEVLDTMGRIARKAELQMALPVPATSRVGRARLVSVALERREEAALDPGDPVRGFAVVPGSRVGAAVFRWDARRGPVREFVPLNGRAALGEDPPIGGRIVASDSRVPSAVLRALRDGLRDRALRSNVVRHSPPVRVLARRVLQLARVAGANRDRQLVGALDGVLTRLHEGVAVGAVRELEVLLVEASPHGIARWLLDHPVRHPGLRAPRLETLLVGGGEG